MSDNPRKFLWLDIETTGLDSQKCAIIEMAVVLTNDKLDVHKEASFVIKPHNENCWTLWSAEKHKSNGLIEEISTNGIDLSVCKSRLMTMLRMWAKPREVALAGRSVHFERDFLSVHMPEVISFLHYRHLDTSTVEMFMEHNNMSEERQKNEAHRAISDIQFTLKQYRTFCAKLQGMVSNGKAHHPKQESA